MTTDNEYLIAGAKGGLPVTYERKKAPKSNLNHDEIWQADVTTFDNKIGFLTNLGSTFYAIRDLFDEDSEEYKIITNRLKVMGVQQNREIDKGKGLSIPPIPKHWSSYQKWDENTSGEDIKIMKLYNSILAKKRPYFMRFLYSHFDKQYRKHHESYNTLSINQFGTSIEELIEKKDKTKDEQKWVDFYYRYSHLIDSPSVMNEISKTMQDGIREIKTIASKLSWKFDVDKEKLKLFMGLYNLWRKNKVLDEDNTLSFELQQRAYRITSNQYEMAKLAISCSFAFALSVFGKEVVELFKKDYVDVPVIDGDLQRCDLNG